MPDQEITFQIDDARLMFKNFSGNKGPYNLEGYRNFAVVIPDDRIDELEQDGWKVKILEPKDEGDTPTAIMKVAVGYTIKPPRVVMIKTNGQVPLTEDTIGLLDFADIRKVDLIVRARPWSRPNGDSGLKAYLKTLYATIEEDELERRYGSNEVVPSGD